MKKFISGLIVGMIIMSTMPIKAAIEEYICYKADYKVIINGTEYIDPDLPILNYKGNTYAPFRSILESSNLSVKWNSEANQAEVTSKGSEEKEAMPASEIEKEIGTIESEIRRINADIFFYTGYIEKLEEKENLNEQEQQEYNEYKSKLNELQIRLAELEERKKELESQLN